MEFSRGRLLESTYGREDVADAANSLRVGVHRLKRALSRQDFRSLSTFIPMFSHPASEYFSVGKIGEDQLEDYAAVGEKVSKKCVSFWQLISNSPYSPVIFLLFSRLTN